MTLVRTNDENALPMMLGVQQQQQHHHLHHHHHLGIHTNSMNNNNNNIQNLHRGNVIMTTGNHSINDSKIQNHPSKKTKMYQTTPYATVPHQPASVARRNARERNRVKQVNNGFATLRQHIPQSVAQALGSNTAGTNGGSRAGSKKLSKVETLKMAVEYIRSLQSLLDDGEGSSDITSASSSSSTSSTSSTSTLSSSISSSPTASTCGSISLIDLNTTELNSPNIKDIHIQQQNIIYDKQHHIRQNQNTTSFIPPPEASSSPTPSFVSETSSAGSQGYGGSTSTVLYTSHQDIYDNYEPMSPEDEELLDVISWWQQSQ